MRLLTWLIRLVLFVVMLGFALSNTDSVSLRFFGIPDFVWRAPLVLFLLIFFAAGALVGVLSSMPVVFRQRRQISRLRKESARATTELQQANAAAAAGTAAASGATAVGTPVTGTTGIGASGTGTGTGTSPGIAAGSNQQLALPTVHESGIRGI